MIATTIPDFGDLELHHLVSDFNGTLAFDGMLLSGVARRLQELSRELTVHVLTADTFGLAQQQLGGLPVKLTILPEEDQAEAKLRYVLTLGAEKTVAVGNGRNDRKMLAAAALGLAVIQEEGGSTEAVLQSDVIVTSIHDALDLLLSPARLKATLRS